MAKPRVSRAPKDGEVTRPKHEDRKTQEDTADGPGGVASTMQPQDAATKIENQDTGTREAVPVAERDKLWTNDSKERWGEGDDEHRQPTLTELLESQKKQKTPKNEQE